MIMDEELCADMPLMMNSGKAVFEEFEDGGAYLFPIDLRNVDAKNDLEDSIGELVCGRCCLLSAVCGRLSGLTVFEIPFQLSARSPSVGRLVT